MIMLANQGFTVHQYGWPLNLKENNFMQQDVSISPKSH